MAEETKKIVITFPCYVKKDAKQIGDVAELPAGEAHYLVGLKRASFDLKAADDLKKAAKAEGKEAKK